MKQSYPAKHHIKPTDFLFKSKDGGAYRTGTFVKGFKANCKKYGIHISGETFKTHDYRHTFGRVSPYSGAAAVSPSSFKFSNGVFDGTVSQKPLE